MKNNTQVETPVTEITTPATPFFARDREAGLPRLKTNVRAGARKQEQSEK